MQIDFSKVIRTIDGEEMKLARAGRDWMNFPKARPSA